MTDHRAFAPNDRSQRLRDAPADRLRECCQDERPDDAHWPFCIELFRRAIVEGCPACWAHIRAIYYRQIHGWVWSHDLPAVIEAEDLVQDALRRFIESYGAEELARAEGKLSSVLGYLKRCATSATLDMWRKLRRRPEVRWDPALVAAQVSRRFRRPPALEHLFQQRLWAAVEACCQDEQDRVIAALTLTYDCRPREIAAARPDLFPDVGDVYRVKRNLLDRLERDDSLAGMLQNWLDER